MCTLLCCAPVSMVAAQSLPAELRIEVLMTAQQFQRAGLSKLSAEELEQLNAWMARYTLAVMQASTPGAGKAGVSGGASAVIESRIDGEFSGWDGETVFKLANGQIWQQASYAYKYHYAFSPKVLIYRSGAGFRMKVDGVDGEIAVRQLR
ncbi:MAG: hypothetical protein IPJ78_19300 [Gemmatimonadetes bacterium]|nr:hypothetical protein [Gemmatimonadota bacterium]